MYQAIKLGRPQYKKGTGRQMLNSTASNTAARAGWLPTIISVIAWTLNASCPAVVEAHSRPLAGEDPGSDWPSYGRTHSEQHYSPLARIRDTNVQQLGLAWFMDLPGQRMLEATPLAINGILYFTGSYGETFAVEAKTGLQRWKFDPRSAEYRPDIFRFRASSMGHRGVAYWRDKIYVGAIDGRLFALNARTGDVVWSVQTFDDPKSSMTISGAPRTFNGKVIIGNSGDFGTRGYVTAYNAESGHQEWRFYTVPGDPSKGFENAALAAAAKTWSGRWWERGGNGSVWDSIVYDSELNRIYLGTANAPGGLVANPSQPDHLFTSSIVALDADTGSYLWHYQENPRGDRDYDSNMPIVLADLRFDGKQRKVLMHAPKNGFFYVIDRSTGKIISAEKFSKVTWAESIDLKSGRPLEVFGAPEVWPSFLGAHSWQPMSFNPKTGLVYLPTMKIGAGAERGLKLIRTEPDDGTATLLAWDPVTQKKRWEVRYSDSFWNGGTMTTAGNLVFQGLGRGELLAYRATTGEKLWSFAAGLGIIASPVSYEIDGIQYVSVLVGYGGLGGLLGKLSDHGWRFNEQPRRLLTFALGGRALLPPGNPPRHHVRAVDDPTVLIDAAQASKGAELYHSLWCVGCHGLQLENTASFAPDLRESVLAINWAAFKTVVHGGVLATSGMPKFGELTDEQLRALYLYIRQRARESKSSPQ